MSKASPQQIVVESLTALHSRLDNLEHLEPEHQEKVAKLLRATATVVIEHYDELAASGS